MTTWQIIRWWELRRIPYNAVLFVIGMTSLLAMEWLQARALPVGRNAIELETGLTVVAYAVLANLCYTLGWIVELAGRKSHNPSDRTRARRLFVVGLCFSCLLTSAPFWLGLVQVFVQRTR
jgi:hypothetical protein